MILRRMTMGTIWSTNITPDPDTGIGDWTLDDCRAALIDGITPDGRHLYPAMPADSLGQRCRARQRR